MGPFKSGAYDTRSCFGNVSVAVPLSYINQLTMADVGVVVRHSDLFQIFHFHFETAHQRNERYVQFRSFIYSADGIRTAIVLCAVRECVSERVYRAQSG